MLEQHTSPAPEPTGPQNSVHCREANDMEFPTIHERANNNSTESNEASRKSGGWATLLGSAVITAFLLVGGPSLLRSASDESQHPNWQHVSAAADASTEGMSQLVRITAAGTEETLTSIEVTPADADRTTTRRVRAALMRNDIAAATIALQAAQRIPSSPDTDVQQPDLSTDPELVAALQEGRKELFQIELFDCCQEDGDVVEIDVNGGYFATVPIMHAGTLLSIPLSSGHNTVTVRGTHDGGGGVTLSFRTSRGDFFARHLRVGEAYQLGVTVQ